MSVLAKPVPYVPASAPFTAEQRAWLNGYLAGLFCDGQTKIAEQSPEAHKPRHPLLILYGSQTGTAEGLAKRIGIDAGKHGCEARVLEMSRFEEVKFQEQSHVLIVTSTWGDGDPPDNAVSFWNHLNSTVPAAFSHISFAVLALGDRNYSSFCGAGRKFDEQLEQLGARRLCPRAECDVEFQPTADAWLQSLWPLLNSHQESETAPDLAPPVERAGVRAELSYSRQHPFAATLLANRNLNAPGSAKETRHLEFSLKDSGLTYEPGDALGVFPCNCPDLVSKIIATLGCDGEEAVPDPEGKETSLRNALLKQYQITTVPRPLIELLARRSDDAKFKLLLDQAHKAELDQYVYGRDVLDVLEGQRGLLPDPKELIGLLRKLQPRLYSISSSPKAHPDEVHITVGALRYESQGRKRSGVCSIFLAERLSPGATVPVFIQASHGFKLPAGPGAPIIMVGPGTGIAPFRAFLEERQATGAKGRNWLFFGDQCQNVDFLYREELQAMFQSGHLTRLDTAFSRDQTEKLYVQHRMLEATTELCAWLEEGAHFYVCGDARRMAKDVDAALHEVISRGLSKTSEQAAEYVAALKAAKRYQRDVY